MFTHRQCNAQVPLAVVILLLLLFLFVVVLAVPVALESWEPARRFVRGWACQHKKVVVTVNDLKRYIYIHQRKPNSPRGAGRFSDLRDNNGVRK